MALSQAVQAPISRRSIEWHAFACARPSIRPNPQAPAETFGRAEYMPASSIANRHF